MPKDEKPAESEPAAEPTEPTPAEAAAAGKAGGQAAIDAAEAGKSRDETQAAVRDAIREELQAQGSAISDEDCERIAGATIAALDARGAFEPQPEPTPEPAPEPGQPPADPESGGGEAHPQPGPADQDRPPQRKTFAERFVGR